MDLYCVYLCLVDIWCIIKLTENIKQVDTETKTAKVVNKAAYSIKATISQHRLIVTFHVMICARNAAVSQIPHFINNLMIVNFSDVSIKHH